MNGELTIERAATASLAPGLVRDGEVVDSDALADSLKKLFKDHKLPRRVRIGVANQRIVVRTVELPPIADAKELGAAVRFVAAEQLPMPLDQAVLDFQPLGLVETPEGERMRVMLVAARRDMVTKLLEAVRGAGLRPEGIDLSAFAMVRALQGPGEHTGNGVAYLNLGGVTNLALASGAQCLFARVMSGGEEGIVAELCERRGLTSDHARQWLSHVGLELPLEQVEGDAEILAEARSILTDGVRRIADEVRSSLDFYAMQDPSVTVERCVLTGSLASVAGVAAAVGAGLGVPVELASVKLSRDDAGAGIDPGRLTIAAGLTIEERR